MAEIYDFLNFEEKKTKNKKKTSKGSRKKSSSLDGRAIKEKRTFFGTFFQRSKSSRGGGVGPEWPGH